MIVYKVTNKINGKVYIGQTTRSLDKRWAQHVRCAKKGVKTKICYAIRKYGAENFELEVLCTAYSKSELNDLEIYYIHKYDSIRTGYNMIDARYVNVMGFDSVRVKHRKCVQSAENRKKISESMKRKIASGEFFTKAHRKRISESAIGNNNGENNSSHSIPCYCIDNNIRRDFKNYKEAGLWWFNTYHPFGEKYSQVTYQRKIIDCIETGGCKFQRKDKTYVYITENDIQWYRKESGANEKVDKN